MQKENKVEKQLLHTIGRESPSEVFLKSKFITVPIHKMCNGEIYSTKVTFGRIEIEARLDSGSDTSLVSQSLIKTIPTATSKKIDIIFTNIPEIIIVL